MNVRRLVTSLGVILFAAFSGLLVTIATGTTPALGLDLKGGVSVTQEPVGEFTQEGLDLTVDRIRERVDAFGIAEPEILRQGDAIVVNLPGVRDQQKALDLVRVTGQVYLRPALQCQDDGIPNPAATTTTTVPGTGDSTPGTGGSTPVTGDSTPDSAVDSTAPDGSTPDSTPTTESTTTTTTPPTVLPPPTTQPGDRLPSDPTTEGFLLVRAPESQATTGFCQLGPALLGPDGKPISTGAVFENDASAQFGSQGWTVTVSLRDGTKGEDVWNQLARLCFAGQSQQCPSGRLAIELDGEIISAPQVNDTNFNGQVSITGNFDEESAEELAQVLNSGSLPVTLRTQAVQFVSPTLGQDSLRAALIAGGVGVFLVLVFMILYYRMLGFVVAAGLVVSGSILWTVIAVLSRVQGLALSLSGVAGIIVSVGVTVDSYVVFFERLKDELKAGKTLRNSATRGYKAAWRTILIADLVSILGAVVLWLLTVGSVRNFAFFLGLSTAIDLVVSYFFTRPAVLLAARGQALGRTNVFGLGKPAVAS